MGTLKAKRGDIQILVNPLTKQYEYISPSNLEILVGKVITNENKKTVVSAIPIKLGVFLSEKEKEISGLSDEISKLNNKFTKLEDQHNALVLKYNALLAAYKSNVAKTAMQLLDLEENK